MDAFAAGADLVGIVPILFTTRAWWIVYHDPPHGSSRLVRVVLCLNSASAALFFCTILLATSERTTAASVLRIAVPNGYLCLCIVLLSGIKSRHRVYRAVLLPSGILVLGWLIAGGLH